MEWIEYMIYHRSIIKQQIPKSLIQSYSKTKKLLSTQIKNPTAMQTNQQKTNQPQPQPQAQAQPQQKPKQQPQPPKKTTQIATNLVDGIFDAMEAEILEGHLCIADEKIQFKGDRKGDRERERGKGREDRERDGDRLGDVLNRKDMVQRELEAILREEEAIKMAKMNQSKSPTQKQKQYFKSELTAEDIQKIKKLKAKQKKFQKELAEKTHQYEQRLKKLKQDEQLTKQRQRKQKYELKKQQIQKTIQVIEKRKLERSARIESQKKAVKEIMGRKKLYEELEEKWRLVQEEEEKKKEELKEELRRLRKVTHEEIKEHEKKYQDAMKIQKQSRMRQSTNPGLDSVTSYRSVFLEQIKQEEKRQKQLIEDRQNRPKEFLSKIKQYGEKIKVYHKPTVKPKDETNQPTTKQKQPQIRSMSLFESHQKGNEYMRTANHQVAQALKKIDTNATATNRQSHEQPRYKNYLKQLRKPQGEQGSKRSSELSTIREILKKENLTSEEKFYQAKILADRMEYKTVVRSPQRMVNSINTKIEILKQLDV